MDSRVASLIQVLRSEGLSEADRTAAHGFPTAEAAGHYADLLRGKLAESGSILGSRAAHVHRGLAAGRVLLAGLLYSHGRSDRWPHAPLLPAEVAAYTDRMARPDMSATRLLGLISRVKKEVAARQLATAKTRYLASQTA